MFATAATSACRSRRTTRSTKRRSPSSTKDCLAARAASSSARKDDFDELGRGARRSRDLHATGDRARRPAVPHRRGGLSLRRDLRSAARARSHRRADRRGARRRVHGPAPDRGADAHPGARRVAEDRLVRRADQRALRAPADRAACAAIPRTMIPAERVRDVLRTHPVAIVRGESCENPFYERPRSCCAMTPRRGSTGSSASFASSNRTRQHLEGTRVVGGGRRGRAGRRAAPPPLRPREARPNPIDSGLG